MQTGKKLCAILLTLCMLVGVLPASVLAAGTDTEVIGQQLMLGDDLCMHLHTNVSQELANPVATISVAGVVAATYNIREMTAQENGSYDLSVHLGAPQMADVINLRIVDGETEVLNADYSIQSYIHYLLENNYTDETKALAKSLLHYGAKAQLYFGYNTANLADEDYKIEVESTIGSEAPSVVVDGSVPGIKYYGSSMVFRSKIAICYYFATDAAASYTYKVDGVEIQPTMKQGQCYIEVANINPDQMDREMLVEVSDGTSQLSFSYSPNAYITRMYNRATTDSKLKDLLVAAKHYFDAAKVFTGVAENRTGALSLQYRYGTNNLIQINTNLPADTPLANFTTSDNGCSIDESANQYQQAAWIGMDNADGTIVLTFHFNGAFEAGQTYTLPKGAIFGFTDNSKYTLDKNYTFTFDGSGWTMATAEPAMTMEYRWGNANTIQYNTNLPVETIGGDFLADANGCQLAQSGDQSVGWISMVNADGTVVLTFNFNGAFAEGGSYTLAAGSVFGFTDGSKYQLNEDVTLYWDGSNWSTTEPVKEITMEYRYGTESLIQYNTNLPATTPCVNFLAADNGCRLTQNVQVGWIGMEAVDGVIVLTFHFNAAFNAGEQYTLSAGSVFGFTDGSSYTLPADVTLYWDGTSWGTEPPAVEPEVGSLSFSYRYGTEQLIQVNTDLPATTPIANFLATDNGCQIDQSANQYQQVGWFSMANADGTIVLTFNFNSAFSAGQTYFLPKGAIFGFTDGSKYALDKDYTFIFDGSNWSIVEPQPEVQNINLTYRWGNNNAIQYNTDLPATTPCANFLAADNGCNLTQNVQVGWIGMEAVDGVIVLTFHFNAAFNAGEQYTLSAGSVFGFTDGSSYTLPADVTLYWDGANWSANEPAKQITLAYRWGNNNTIQYNTDLPATTPLASFTASENGSNLIQTANQYQNVGWIGMDNVDGTIVLTFHFNGTFNAGENYVLSAGSVFGFTDGSSYTLPADVDLYWNGSVWSDDPVITLDYRWGDAKTIQYNTNLPATTPIANFTASDNGSNLIQTANQYQNVGWIGMANAEGTIVLTFNFNGEFAIGQNYILSAGSVFGFTDGSSYTLPADVNLYWDGTSWGADAPEVKDVLDESNFTGGDVITFADLPVDGNNAAKLAEYVALGFNTSLIAEDHTNAQGPDERYSVSLQTANEPSDILSFTYRYGTGNLIQVNTNLPSDTPCVNFTVGDNECDIDQSGNTVQWVGWIGMDNVDGVIVLSFHFNNAFTAGQSYVLPKDALFGFTDGNMYLLDGDYTFTFDGTAWSTDCSVLKMSLNSGAAKYMQLKTNIPTGLSYGDFLVGDTSKGNLILEKSDGAMDVAWFSYSELSGAVYLTLNFNGYQKPGTQYTLKAGTTLKAGDKVYTTDRDYILTVQNDYLSALENLNNAGLKVWIRNHHNTSDYFTTNLTAALKLYEDTIDGFYMTDEPFQTAAMLQASGQTGASDLESMTAVRDWFNQNFADKYFHVNHVPISSWDHYTGVNGETLSTIDAAGYRNFLTLYKQNFNDLLTSASGTSVSFDNYPFVHDQGKYGGFLGFGGTFESGIQDTYLLNCLIAAQVAGEDDFGLCIQTFEATDQKNNTTRDIVSAAEVSLQLYTGFAMGADVFEYFAYNSNDTFSAIMNQDGSKRIYDLVKEGNNALCFADVVNSFAWNGIVTSAGSSNNHNGDAFTSVANMVLTNDTNGVLDSYSSTDDAIIGCFTKDGLNGYMLVNYNDPAAVTGNNSVTVTFADCTRARVYTQAGGVLTSEVVELTNGSYTATLAPGAGCFIIPA